MSLLPPPASGPDRTMLYALAAFIVVAVILGALL